MPKLASYWSVRGARDNSRPYRERGRPTVKVTRLTQPTFGLNVSEVALRISPTGRVGSLTEQRCRRETTDHRRRNRQVSKGSKCQGSKGDFHRTRYRLDRCNRLRSAPDQIKDQTTRQSRSQSATTATTAAMPPATRMMSAYSGAASDTL
jgi:hypothetical protein